MSYQCQRALAQINAKPMDMISARMFRREPNYSLAVVNAESPYQLSIFLDVSLKIGFKSVITSNALLYIRS